MLVRYPLTKVSEEPKQHETPFLQNLRAAVLAEAEASLKSNADVAAKWAALFTPGVPQDLAADIEKQRQVSQFGN